MRLLILGSKEYPVGSGSKEDTLGSGGYEIFSQNLAFQLVKLNQKPVIITRSFKNQNWFEKKNCVEVHRIPWINGFFFRTPSYNFFSIFKILSIKYDVAICSGIFSSLVAEITRIFNQKPVIVRPAGFAFNQPQYHFFLKILLKMLQEFVCNNANATVFVSPDEKNNFKKYFGGIPKNSVVIKTGVTAPVFDVKKINEIKKQFGGKQVKKLVFIGRLSETKGIEYLLEALEKIESNKKHCLLIIGDGPLKEKLVKKVSKDSFLKNRVFFLGFQQNAMEFIQAADIFILPSVSEGLPIALLEAMACEKPCVVTDIGLPVKNEETALIVPPKNPSALAKAITRLLRDEKLAAKLGKNAINKVKKEFSWDRAAKEYLQLARRLVKKE